MQKDWTIYTLSDPRTNSVRYVGKTYQPIRRRYLGHLSQARHGGESHKDRWLRLLLSLGLEPVCTVIERGLGKSWVRAERQWVALYRGVCHLTNLTDGGDGALGRPCSPATRAKLSVAKRDMSPETRAKMSAAMRGHKNFLGHHHSPETRAKMSAASKRQRGRPCSPATRAKMSAAHKGKVFSAETRAKMSIIAAAGPARKPVVCIETGELFSSIRAAARGLGVQGCSLGQAMKEHRGCQGFHFILTELGGKP